MSEFWNSVRNVSARAGGDAARIDGLVGESSVQEYCLGDESVEYVLTASDGLVRGSDDWETTEEPGQGRGAVVLVTDRRVTVVVGDCRDPDVTGDYVRRVPLAEVDSVTVERSLLSTTFAIRTDEGVRLAVDPEEDDVLSDVERFVRRASLRWAAAQSFLDQFETTIEEVESAFAAGETDEATARAQMLRNEVSELGESSSVHAVELPALDDALDRARDRIENAESQGYWRRTRTLLATGDTARDEGAFADAAASYERAAAALRSMYESTGSPTVADSECDPEHLPDALGDALCARLETCAVELDGSDPDALRAVVDGYEALRDALAVDADAVDPDDETLIYQLTWLVARTADRFADRADRLEAEGDDARESGEEGTARDRYDAAIEAVEACERLGREYSQEFLPEGVAERRDRLEEKVERLAWEWVGDP